LDIGNIYAFFQTPQPIFLQPEPAVCYILHTLLKADSYGTGLIRQLEEDYPGYRLSDTLLYKVLKFLEEEKFITDYVKSEGRGRPRRMFKLASDKGEKAQELAHLWQNYVIQHSIPQ
jgi:DNA-binding PadR family transcriptional regulator